MKVNVISQDGTTIKLLMGGDIMKWQRILFQKFVESLPNKPVRPSPVD